jgi:hypothetical protein
MPNSPDNNSASSSVGLDKAHTRDSEASARASSGGKSEQNRSENVNKPENKPAGSPQDAMPDRKPASKQHDAGAANREARGLTPEQDSRPRTAPDTTLAANRAPDNPDDQRDKWLENVQRTAENGPPLKKDDLRPTRATTRRRWRN